MSKPLEVLLIESKPGDGAADADLLVAAGHRVHRCYASRASGSGRTPLRERHLCSALTNGTCPLDEGVDVALLVRGRMTTHPTAREAGVSCALRAGIPVVEDGPDLLDPYEPWLTSRVEGGEVARACEDAATKGFASLRDDIVRRVHPLAAAAGLDARALTCRFETDGPRLRVVVCGPAVTTAFENALAVRVLDAVRSARRSFGQVDVTYEVG